MNKLLLAISACALLSVGATATAGPLASHALHVSPVMPALAALPAVSARAPLASFSSLDSSRSAALPGLASPTATTIGPVVISPNEKGVQGVVTYRTNCDGCNPYNVLNGSVDTYWLYYDTAYWPAYVKYWAQDYVVPLAYTVTPFLFRPCEGCKITKPVPYTMAVVSGAPAFLQNIANGAVGLVIVHPIPPIRFPGQGAP